MNAVAIDRLLWRPSVRVNPAARLFCFSYAGMGASAYRLWPAALPPELDVLAIRLPGRESRLTEAPLLSIDSIVAALEPAVVPHLDLPFAFFGHSMGSVVAFELARALVRAGHPEPACLFVSGRRPPRLQDAEPPMHELPVTEFTSEVQRRYGGIPAAILEEPDLMAMLLPGLRADIKALETHVSVSGPVLSCPIVAFAGTDDRCTPNAHLDAWRDETSGSFRARRFPGGHFYLADAREAVAADIAAAIISRIGSGRQESAH